MERSWSLGARRYQGNDGIGLGLEKSLRIGPLYRGRSSVLDLCAIDRVTGAVYRNGANAEVGFFR